MNPRRMSRQRAQAHSLGMTSRSTPFVFSAAPRRGIPSASRGTSHFAASSLSLKIFVRVISESSRRPGRSGDGKINPSALESKRTSLFQARRAPDPIAGWRCSLALISFSRGLECATSRAARSISLHMPQACESHRERQAVRIKNSKGQPSRSWPRRSRLRIVSSAAGTLHDMGAPGNSTGRLAWPGARRQEFRLRCSSR